MSGLGLPLEAGKDAAVDILGICAVDPPSHLLRRPGWLSLALGHCFVDLAGHSSLAQYLSLFHPLASCVISISTSSALEL